LRKELLRGSKTYRIAAGATVVGIRRQITAGAIAQSLTGGASGDCDSSGDSDGRHRSRGRNSRGGNAPARAGAAIGSGTCAGARVHGNAGRRDRNRSAAAGLALARKDIGDSHGCGRSDGPCLW
jgi:hypothetical protein